jgi:hypothetical protein
MSDRENHKSSDPNQSYQWSVFLPDQNIWVWSKVEGHEGEAWHWQLFYSGL